ncbi:MAG: hypothetical protein U0838_15465 [Chloroflexota bacterium]
MSIARALASHIDEFRLRQARADAHRARLDFLRADWFGGDLEQPSRRVVLATARVEHLEAVVRRQHRHH